MSRQVSASKPLSKLQPAFTSKASTDFTGEGATKASHPSNHSSGSLSFPALISPAGRVLNYVPDEAFLSPAAEVDILKAYTAEGRRTERRSSQSTGSMSAYMASLWRVPLLSREEEIYHFRKLNFLRFQAALLQNELKTCRGHAGMLRQLAVKLEQATLSRNLLIEANLRLVMSIAKRYANEHLTVDDLVSVGNTALVNAVDQFDYRRGFRFSTYAYQAVQRSIFGALRSEYRNLDRFSTDAYEVTHSLTKDASHCEVAKLQADEARVEVEQLLSMLEPRSRMIVMARFGIVPGTEPSSFQSIAGTIGLSKQRVASIFAESMSKLRIAIARGKVDLQRT